MKLSNARTNSLKAIKHSIYKALPGLLSLFLFTSANAATAPIQDEPRQCLGILEGLVLTGTFRTICEDCGEEDLSDMLSRLEAARRELSGLQAQVNNSRGFCSIPTSEACNGVRNRINELQNAIAEAESHPWLIAHRECMEQREHAEDFFVNSCKDKFIERALAECVNLPRFMCPTEQSLQGPAQAFCEGLLNNLTPNMCSFFDAVEDHRANCRTNYERDMANCESARNVNACRFAAAATQAQCLMSNPEDFPEGNPLNNLSDFTNGEACEPSPSPSTQASPSPTIRQPSPTPTLRQPTVYNKY